MLEESGWISLHRKIKDSPIYSDSQAVHLWVHLLLSVNHKDKTFMYNGKLTTVKRGQIITGRQALAMATGISESKVQRLLVAFEELKMIEQQTNSKNRYISITNYDLYQQSEQQVNSRRTAGEQRVNTNNNDNNDNNVNNIYNVEKPESKPVSANADVMAVFEHWQIRMNHKAARLDDKRKKLITKAIKLGYSTDDLIAAIDGCAKSPFHMGQNDRGAVYDGLDLILRDASKIDGFIKNNSLTQQQGGSLNENSRNHDRISQLSKTAAGRMQLNIERELAEIQASRQRGDNTLVGSDEECVLAQVDFDVSGRRD